MPVASSCDLAHSSASTVILPDQITETGPGTEDQEQYGDEAKQETDGSAFGRGGEGCEPGRVVGLACFDERLRRQGRRVMRAA